MLRLYYADISELKADCFDNILSQYRLDKLKAQKDELKQKQGIGAELLLQHALVQVCPKIKLPPDIELSLHGKPSLKNSELHFSLSHSGRFSACAVSDCSLGLDIQLLRPYNERLVRRFFTQGEGDWLSGSLEQGRDFTMLWALKEAYLKALGTGLNTPLSSFEISLGSGISINPPLECAFWQEFRDDCQFALCLMGAATAKPDSFEEIKLL